MNFNVNQETQDRAREILEKGEDKVQAIVDTIELLAAEQHADLIKQLQADNEVIKANAEVATKMGYRTLNKDEKKFYETLRGGARQSVTFTQEDIFPTSIIDVTLADVKKASPTLKLVKMAPTGVKKWLIGSKTGTAAWGGLTDELTSELTAKIESLDIEVNKLHVMLIVPKAVRELALPLVDKYFSAILAEAMHDGLVKGYIDGDGKTAPIGIMRTSEVNADSTHKSKTVKTNITNFKPATLAETLKTLSKDGIRTIEKLYLIANPNDVFTYVNPALFYFNGNGYVSTSKIEIEVIQEPMMASGKAVLTIADAYTMGMGNLGIHEYKEVKAVEDCDVFIAKVYANGKADDDNTAVVFNVTKLEEYIPTVQNIDITPAGA